MTFQPSPVITLHALISKVGKSVIWEKPGLYLPSSFPARRIDSLMKYGDVRKIWPPESRPPSCILREAVEAEEVERRLEE